MGMFAAFTAFSLSFLAYSTELSCDQRSVERLIHREGPQTDRMFRFRGGLELLPAGVMIWDFYQNPVASFEEEKLVQYFAGSYHSGWFEEVAVIDPKSCQIEAFFNIYSE